MAIQLITTTKQASGIYSVTVQDTSQQIGTNDNSEPIYKMYTVKHNSAVSVDDLKKRIESVISADQKKDADIETVKTAIKSTVESIDTSNLAAIKEVS